MRIYFLGIGILLISLNGVCQSNKITTRYFKDIQKWKEVKEKKANYKEVVSKIENGIIKIEIINISTGIVLKIQKYKNDQPIGKWKYFDEKGMVISVRDFDKLIYLKEPIRELYDNKINEENKDKYEKASFGESEKDIFKYLMESVRYPSEAKTEGVNGKVYVRLLIKKNGNAEVSSIVKSAHPLLDLEAWRVLEEMPNKWNPAKKNGELIDSYWNIPINFVLK